MKTPPDSTITATCSTAPERNGHEGLLYCPPRLVILGDVRMLTLGGSPGFSDSSQQPENQPE